MHSLTRSQNIYYKLMANKHSKGKQDTWPYWAFRMKLVMIDGSANERQANYYIGTAATNSTTPFSQQSYGIEKTRLLERVPLLVPHEWRHERSHKRCSTNTEDQQT